jgi:alkanesulfonate monooxygenase SsuD/methylene tetrahydromethanopterin reductase-like flavin-dependent oxidoreductase (luciferase family)
MRVVEFAISVPQLFDDGTFDQSALQAYLSRAEELGFSGVWVTEQVIGTAPELDPSVLLALAAAYTSRVRLGCAVYVSTLNSPLHLAKTIATLDQVSGGRVEVGLGTGGGFRTFEAFGMEREGFVSRFTEGLRYMQAAWTQERIDLDGRFWQAHGLAMEPKPVQKPYPPIWFGGGHPNSLRRAVRLADGFMGAGSTATASYLDQARIVHDEVAKAGRDPGTFRVAKRVYVAVDDDPVRAEVRLTQGLERLYSFFGLTGIGRVGVSGRPADVAEVLQSILDAGTDVVLLHPLYDGAEQMERLAADVLPLLRTG